MRRGLSLLAAALWLCGLPGRAEDGEPPPAEDWSLHGQITVTDQMHPPFRSPYQGAQSLSGKFQAKETTSADLYAGVKLWRGAEAYADPEMGQGYGFDNAYGIASFPNGEAATAGYLYPHVYMAKYFLRQVIGLGDETEAVEAGANQLAGSQPVDRLTLVAGRIYLPDYFDTNIYAHDARANFTNWAIWESGAYDYPGNPRGYTNGAVVELNQADWAVRYGVAENVASLGGWDLSPHVAAILSHNLEGEGRYELDGQPGRLRLLAFLNYGPMGDYAEALSAVRRGIAAAEAMRRARADGHSKRGATFSLEQALSPDLGVFARLSWNDGHTEDWSNTDIDQSVALGGQLKGTAWDRADDAVGLALAVSGLSSGHRDFLAAGGYTIQIGDGRLPHYGLEKAVEAYYAYKMSEPLTVSLDCQFIANPGYNRDRGPVPVFGGRIHAEF
jgi:high affinity Mn2+ porin